MPCTLRCGRAQHTCMLLGGSLHVHDAFPWLLSLHGLVHGCHTTYATCRQSACMRSVKFDLLVAACQSVCACVAQRSVWLRSCTAKVAASVRGRWRMSTKSFARFADHCCEWEHLGVRGRKKLHNSWSYMLAVVTKLCTCKGMCEHSPWLEQLLVPIMRSK